MTKCGCETGNDCTKTTVCQCELTADKLAEALERLAKLGNEPRYGNSVGNEIAKAALKEYRDNAA